MKVLVTGGAGYIGSHAVRKLLKAGHEVVVLDDLSKGHEQAIAAAGHGLSQKAATFARISILEHEKVKTLLRDQKIEAVFHFAAFIEVGESVAHPELYYINNFMGALQLLDAMRETGVSKFAFSSTAAVYGNPQKTPITEDHPRLPINPYGSSKMMVEMALQDFATAHGLGYAILRYFNVAGATPDGVIGESHEPESHLIPRILAAASESREIGIFGTDYPTPDGTCIRDYVHVEDLIDAHLLAMAKIQAGKGNIYNLGSETGFSVRQVIQAAEKVTGRSIKTKEHPRRPGDPAILVASSSKIRSELGWKCTYPHLESMIEHAWKWQSKRFRRKS